MRHNIQQQARKPISKPQHLSSQQRTTTHEPEPQPQTAECSNYGHQGLSDRLALRHNSDAPGSIGSIILYRAFLIRPKICRLLLKFGGKQQILGLIRKALYESSAKVVRLERKTYLFCTISVI